jgi:hypothetical protein
MRGREFITLLGGTWPFAERAQTPARSEGCTSHKCEPWMFVISSISSRWVASHQRRPS